MMHRALICLALSLMIGGLLSGCPDLGERYAARELWLAEPVSWAEVEPVFKRRCVACHGPVPAGGATMSLSTYAEVQPWLERVRVRALVLDNMPPGGLQDPDERDVLARWLALGGPEHPLHTEAGVEAGVEAGAEPEVPSWRDVRSVLTIYCNTCHAEIPTGGASFGLTTYADAASRQEALYDRVIVRQDMPPGGLRDAEALMTLEAWLNAGAPE